MNNRIKKSIRCILGLLILLQGVLVGHTYAEDKGNILLGIKDFEAIDRVVDFEKENLTLTFWKLDKIVSEKDSYRELVRLEKFSERDLSNQYQELTRDVIIQDKSILVRDLEPGSYYFRYLIESKNHIYHAPIIVTVVAGETVKVQTKVEIPDEPETDEPEKPETPTEPETDEPETPTEPETDEPGVPETPVPNVKIHKVDQFGERLEGVGFELYRVVDGELIPVGVRDNGLYDPTVEPRVLYTDENGEILVFGLPEGDYIWKEVAPLDGYIVKDEETAFNSTPTSEIDLYIENEKEDVPTGDHGFLKIKDEDKEPLAGAVFKVMRRVDDEAYPVMLKGKEIILTSGEDGLFFVEGLPYGDYELWEIEAPKGYVLLKEPVKFRINETSGTTVISITNKEKPPIEVPDTGDIAIYVLLLVSVGIFIYGYRMTRQEEN